MSVRAAAAPPCRAISAPICCLVGRQRASQPRSASSTSCIGGSHRSFAAPARAQRNRTRSIRMLTGLDSCLMIEADPRSTMREAPGQLSHLDITERQRTAGEAPAAAHQPGQTARKKPGRTGPERTVRHLSTTASRCRTAIVRLRLSLKNASPRPGRPLGHVVSAPGAHRAAAIRALPRTQRQKGPLMNSR